MRQVYQSLILAVWYKKKIRQSLLSSAYVDRNKTAGINIDDPQEARQIWERYAESFGIGVYTLLKEEADGSGSEMIPRKYFSGGANLSELELVTTENLPATSDERETTIKTLIQPYYAQTRQNSDAGQLAILKRYPSIKSLFAAGAHRYVFPVILAGSMSCTGCAGLFYKGNDIANEHSDVSAEADALANIPSEILKDTRGKISPRDWKESLLVSQQNRGMVKESRKFLLC